VLETDILSRIMNEGIQLKQSGKSWIGHCPFHDDHHPSFCVYPDRNRFVCYGCGEKGDAIDFIMKMRNISFRETIAYLGIDAGHEPQKDPITINKRELIASFRQWHNEYYDELSNLYRVFHKLLMNVKTIGEAEKYSFFYHQVSIWECHMDILLYGDDEEKFNLFKEVAL
jgi:DNA primase